MTTFAEPDDITLGEVREEDNTMCHVHTVLKELSAKKQRNQSLGLGGGWEALAEGGLRLQGE